MHWSCTAGNGFGHGLPAAADNQSRWPWAQPLLANSALVPDCAATELATGGYQDLLEVRGSSPLFGLATADQVQKVVSFPLSGSGETPGVITMKLTDIGPGRGLDARWRSIVVVFNASPTSQTQTIPGLRGASVALHPALTEGGTFAPTTGTFTVAPRTVAVFVQS